MRGWTWLERNKWFILAVLFLGLNSWAVLRLERPARRINGGYCLAAFEPGEGATVASNAAVAWRFNEAMVGPEAIGEWTESGPAVFAPEVRGRFRWTAADRLEFRPENNWPLCTPFTVSLDERLAGLSSRAVAAPRTFAFRSEALAFLGAEQVAISDDSAMTLLLRFNAPVLPADLKQHLTLRSATGQTLGWEPSGQMAGHHAMVVTDEFPGPSVTVSLRQGLRSPAGPLGLGQNVERTIPCYDHLAVTDFRTACPAFEPGHILFRTSVPLDLNQAASFIRVEPAVRFTLEAFPYTYYAGRTEYRLSGPFEPGRAYTVTFQAGLPASEGYALREPLAHAAFIPNRPRGLTFRTAGTYLSSRGSRQVPVLTSSIRRLAVKAERVYPNNLVQFAMRRAGRYETSWWERSQPHQAISHVAATAEYAVVRSSNDLAETRIPLRSLLGERASGAFYLTASGDGESVSDQHLVILSDIGLSVKRSDRDLLVWANSILTLAPVTGAEVRVFSAANQELASGVTDRQGLLHLSGDFTGAAGPFILVASQGEDLTYLALDESGVSVPGNRVGPAYLAEGYEAYVYTDRGIYRPGETARVKAVVRAPGLECPPAFPVELEVIRPDGRKRPALAGMLNDLGAAEFEVGWAEYDLTGRYTLRVRAPGGEKPLGEASVAVEEFVPPQIAVTAESDPGRGRAGEELAFRVAARHLFGAPSAGNRVRAGVTFSPKDFAHPDWPDYTFSDPAKLFTAVSKDFGSKALDGQGHGYYRAQAQTNWRPASALEAVFMAAVMDMGGRTVAARISRPVDVYPFYVGIRRPGQGAVMAGKPLSLELAAVRPDGLAVTGAVPLRLTLASVSWSSVLRLDSDGRYRYRSERRSTPVLEQGLALENGRGRHTITPAAAGEYVLTLSDPEGGASAALPLYVGSPDQEWQAWSMETPDRATLRFDRKSYEPGQEAVLAIQAPFAGKALLTLESDRVLESRVLVLEGNTAEVRIPVKAEYQPNVYAVLSLIRPVVPDETWTPHRAVGAAALKVEQPAARLALDLEASQAVRPLESLEVAVALRRADGGPEPGAEIVLAAVDEGICMLTDFQTPDPLGFFMAQRRSGVELYDLYARLMPELGPAVGGSASRPGGDLDALLKRSLNPMRAQRFKPVALWRSGVRTGPDGRAKVSLAVPEFTGELRIMAVAIGTNRFGSVARPVTVRRPLVARSALPRFLAPGDACRLPVELVNGTGADGEAVVRIECEGPLALAGTAEQRFALAAGARAEAVFDLLAGVRAGVGKVRVVASLGTERAVEETELSVRPPLPAVTLSGSGAAAAGETVAVPFPTNWVPGTARYALAAAGLPGIRLGGALDYLLTYPHGCLEQTTSSAFPLLYLADLAEQVLPGSITAGDTRRRIEAGILRVLSMQTHSGGFAYWPHSTEEYEWGAVYATHFLLEAVRAGHQVPRERLEAAVRYLQGLLARTSATELGSLYWRYDMNLRAYACYVLALAGQPEPGWVSRLRELGDKADPDALAHVAAALAAAGQRREAAGLLQALGGGANFNVPRQTGGSLDSAARTAALLLNLWLDLDPEHPDVPGLASRLDGLRTGDRWFTTQENAMALLAMGKYARWLSGREKAMSATVAWCGGSRLFDRATPVRLEWEAEPPANLAISNAGPGTAYFSWRAAGVPDSGELREEDTGFRIRRRLFQAGGQPVSGDTFIQGELYVVGWQLDGLQAGADNLVIEDLLPAGFEIENPGLHTSEIIAWAKEKCSMPMRQVEARDDRMLGFTRDVSGACQFFYAVRAVSEGEFVMPPLQASCMYDPGLRSISGSRRIRVVPADKTGE